MSYYSHTVARDKTGLWMALGTAMLLAAIVLALCLCCSGCIHWPGVDAGEHTPHHYAPQPDPMPTP